MLKIKNEYLVKFEIITVEYDENITKPKKLKSSNATLIIKVEQ